MTIRDRIRELRRVRAADLLPDPKNWRTHPQAQQDALRAMLAEVGFADALLAREIAGGQLMLIDGHLRAETTPDALVPVLILDVDEAEAAKLLATIDPLAALAGTDRDKLDALLHDIDTGDAALQEMLTGLAEQHGLLPLEPKTVADVIPEQFCILIECNSEQHQDELLLRLQAEGLTCRALLS